jgi:hypothetical protein
MDKDMSAIAVFTMKHAVKIVQRQWREYKRKKQLGQLSESVDTNPFVSSLAARQMLFRNPSSIDTLQFKVLEEEVKCCQYPDKTATRFCMGCGGAFFSEEAFRELHDRGYRKRHLY